MLSMQIQIVTKLITEIGINFLEVSTLKYISRLGVASKGLLICHV